jgi:hypothetical protein
VYRAYDEIFAEHGPRDRELLLRTTEQWYGDMALLRPPDQRVI